MSAEQHVAFKYLVANDRDRHWGITVSSVGWQQVAPGEEYPSREHPQGYYFNPQEGRVLDEYQLIYLVEGGGTFEVDGALKRVTQGDMMLLLPGIKHTYTPDVHVGWSVYWIGFTGSTVDQRMVSGFFDQGRYLFHLGIHVFAIELYRKALEVSQNQGSFYQQMLSGTVAQLLGFMLYQHQADNDSCSEVHDRVVKAKLLMQEHMAENITPQEIARRLHVSYSSFRAMFRRETGMAPVQYMLELKLWRAKELLSDQSIHIKEIAYALDFSSPRYFSTFFKTKTGITPQEFRNRL